MLSFEKGQWSGSRAETVGDPVPGEPVPGFEAKVKPRWFTMTATRDAARSSPMKKPARSRRFVRAGVEKIVAHGRLSTDLIACILGRDEPGGS